MRHPQRMFEMPVRFVQSVERRVDRFDDRLDQRRCLSGAALEPPHRGRERRHRRLRPGNGFLGRTQILGGFFRLHHGGAPVGERSLLARLGGELAEFVDRVPQPFRFAAGALDFGAMRRDRGLAFAPFVPQPAYPDGVGLDAAKRIDERAVRRGIDKRTIVVLAVDFHQRHAERREVSAR